MKKERKKIAVSSTTRNSSSGYGEIHIVNLTEEELEKFSATIKSGHYFVTVEEGKLVAIPKFKKLPDPITDEDMDPFWRKFKSDAVQGELFNTRSKEEHSIFSASISIQHLCAYSYSEQKYKMYAERLESYGFECLRSKRNNEGNFWEIWFLPSLIFAKGDLSKKIKSIKDEKEQLDAALYFFRENISFGTLDVSIQRMATVFED